MFDTLQDAISFTIGVMAVTLTVAWACPMRELNDSREWSGERVNWTIRKPIQSGWYWWRGDQSLYCDANAETS